MFDKKILPIACLIGSLSTIGASATKQPHPLRAQARFLATSASVQSGLGTKQDVYLVEVMPQNSTDVILARLIDEYPPYRATLSSDVLISTEGTILKIRRDPTCDIAFGQMPLRSAPGDWMAILPDRLGFQPELPSSIDPDKILPCYRKVR